LLQFFENINKFDKLEVLDLSWNQIGKSNDTVCKIFEMLSSNKKLVRFDLSHNSITNITDYQLWYELLNKNHTLMGFSVTGNSLRLDIDQYLKMP